MQTERFTIFDIVVAQNRYRRSVSIISSLHHRATKSTRLRFPTETTLHASIPSSLIRADDCWSLWAFIAASAAAGLQLEQKTSVGKALSGPVCSMLLSALATNIGILPIAGSPYISQLQSFVVKVATPLLLLGADLRKIFKDTKGLVNAFFVGTIGTLLGSVLSYSVCHSLLESVGLPGDGWKLAAALTAKNIGGGLNFMAVVDILAVSPAAVSTGLTVDNILGLLFNQLPEEQVKVLDPQPDRDAAALLLPTSSSDITVDNLSLSLAVGLCVVAAAEHLSRPLALPALTISTALTVLLASALPVAASGDLVGKMLLLLFFGSIGSSAGDLRAALTDPGSFAVGLFGLGLYIVHLAVVFFSRLLPAVLVGTLGNIIGSFLGLGLGYQVLLPLSSQ
eukprot:gene26116-34725_t